MPPVWPSMAAVRSGIVTRSFSTSSSLAAPVNATGWKLTPRTTRIRFAAYRMISPTSWSLRPWITVGTRTTPILAVMHRSSARSWVARNGFVARETPSKWR